MGEMSVRLQYEPTQRQALFHASSADEVLFGGAAGGGKSVAIVMEALLRCLRYPGSRAYVFRRTYRELDDVLLPILRERTPKELGQYDGSSRTMRLVNGSEIRLRHCCADQDRFRYQGAEIHFLFIDELTHFTKEVFDFLKSRLRAARALALRPCVRCTANPGGIGHAWVKQYFVDCGAGRVFEERVLSAVLGKERKVSRLYVPARATDNPHIGEDYIFELEQKPRALRDALLYGSWDAFDGQVFCEWRDDLEHYGDRKHTHVIEPFDIPSDWPRFRSFDFGYTKPFSVLWWAVDYDGIAYLYREWYGADGPNEGIRLGAEEIARGILQAEQETGETVTAFADPSIWDGSRGESIAEEMAREGVYFYPGENARLSGKMQLHRRLSFDGEGRPGMYVFSTCREFIRCIPALVYDPYRVEDVDTRGEDHCYDAARYFLMSRPVAPKAVQHKRKVFDPLGEDEGTGRRGFLSS
ncbi:MAG: phage terminase large subunit [Christensenellales bacterium]